jgi:hypothetical protein
MNSTDDERMNAATNDLLKQFYIIYTIQINKD